MKAVLVTRPKEQAAEFAARLRTAGFEAVFLPVIDIQPMPDPFWLDRAIQKLACFDWIIFTSVNGVAIFWDRMLTFGLSTFPAGSRIAAIGPKTAEALETRGVPVLFVPDEYIAEAILPGLGDVRGSWILLPRAEIARKALPEAITRAGGLIQEVAVYRTLALEPDPGGLAALRAGIDVLTFTSPSTVTTLPVIETILQTLSAIRLGRTGARQANTPVKGFFGSPRGCTRSIRRCAGVSFLSNQ